MDVTDLRGYEHLSPFEIKDELIRLAHTSGQTAGHMFLNAGRGNPNWVATRACESFFLLGQFAIGESMRAQALRARPVLSPRCRLIVASTIRPDIARKPWRFSQASNLAVKSGVPVLRRHSRPLLRGLE